MIFTFNRNRAKNNKDFSKKLIFTVYRNRAKKKKITKNFRKIYFHSVPPPPPPRLTSAQRQSVQRFCPRQVWQRAVELVLPELLEPGVPLVLEGLQLEVSVVEVRNVRTFDFHGNSAHELVLFVLDNVCPVRPPVTGPGKKLRIFKIGKLKIRQRK